MTWHPIGGVYRPTPASVAPVPSIASLDLAVSGFVDFSSSISTGSTTSAVLTPLAFLVASITPAATTTAALEVDVEFAGAITPGSTTSAVLTPYAFLDSAVSTGSTVAAILTPYAFLDSAITPSSTTTGALHVGVHLAGSITPRAIVAGVLTPFAFLDSAIAPSSTIVAVLTPYAFLDSLITPGATVFAVLDVLEAGFVDLAGAITPSATVGGVLTPLAFFDAVIAPGSTTTAVLTPLALLSSAIMPGTTVVAVLTPLALLDASITPGSTTAGLLDLVVDLIASISPGSTVDGLLTPYAFLDAAITPGATTSALLDVLGALGALVGLAEGTATAQAFPVPSRAKLLIIRRTAGGTSSPLDFGIESSEVVFQTITRIAGPQVIVGREDVPEVGLFLGLARGTATATGTLAGSGRMAGTAQGAATASAVPALFGRLIGTASGSSSATALHSRMIGQASGQATADAFPELSGAMVGLAIGRATVAAVQGVMVGQATGVAAATAVPRPAGPLFGTAIGRATVTAFQGVMVGQSSGASDATAIPATEKGAVDDIIEFDKPTTFTEDYLVRCVFPIEPTAVDPPPLYINDVRCQEEVVARDARGFASEIEVIAPVDVALSDPDNIIRVVLNESGVGPAPSFQQRAGPFEDDLSSMFLRIKVENVTQALRAPIFTYATPTVREDGGYVKQERFYSRFVIEGGGTTEILQVYAYIIRRSDVPVFELCIDVRNGAIDTSLSHYMEQSAQDGRVYLEWIEIGGIPVTHGLTTWAERPTMDIAGGYLLRPAADLVGGQPNHRYLMHTGAWMRRRMVVHRNGWGGRTGAIQAQRGRGRTLGPNSYYRRGQFGPDGFTIPQWDSDFSYNGKTGQAALKSYFAGILSAVRGDLRIGSGNVLNHGEHGWMRPFGDPGSGTSGGSDILMNSSHAHCEEGWHLHREFSDLSAERSWASMFNVSDGKIADIHNWAAAHGGTTPWAVTNQGNVATAHPFSLHPITGSNRALMFTGHPWNELESGNVNAFPRTDLLEPGLPFRPRNITHCVRTWYNARAAAWFTNDWPTVDFVHALDAYYGWQANSYGVDPNPPGGPWHIVAMHLVGMDIPFARQWMIDNSALNQAQIGFNRDPGWGWHLVTMRYALGTAAERALDAPRLDAMHLLAFENATALGANKRIHPFFACTTTGVGTVHPYAEGLHGPTNIPGLTGAFPDKFADWGTCAVPVVEPFWDFSQAHLSSFFLQSLFGIYYRRYLNLDAPKAANALSDAVRLMRANFEAIGTVGNEAIQLFWHTGESDYLGVWLAPATTFTKWAFTGGNILFHDLDPQTWCGMLFVADANDDFLLHHWPSLRGFNAPGNTFASVVQEFMTQSSQGGDWAPPSMASLSVANAAWPCGLAQRQLAAPALPPPST